MKLTNEQERFLKELDTWAVSDDIEDEACANYIQNMLREIYPSRPGKKEESLKHMPSIENAKKALIDSYEDYMEYVKRSQQDIEYFNQLNGNVEEEIKDAIEEFKDILKSEQDDDDMEFLNNLHWSASQIYPKTEFAVFSMEYILEAINNDGKNRKHLLSMGTAKAKTFLKKEYVGIKESDKSANIWLIDLIPDF